MISREGLDVGVVEAATTEKGALIKTNSDGMKETLSHDKIAAMMAAGKKRAGIPKGRKHV